MTPRNDTSLAALAQEVADGRTPDWAAAIDGVQSPRERSLIGRLQSIADISRAHAVTSGSEGGEELGVEPVPLPPFTWGTLQVIEQIGRGRFGRVYRARDPGLDREVALKILDHPDADEAKAAVEEGRLAARVRHPNVVTIFGAQRIDGRTGIWMELIQGRTLDTEIRERGPFNEGEIRTAAGELCRALAAVHSAGLVHRDVKSTNVMREREGRFVLGDFGTGRAMDETDAARAGLAGTPAFLAPEIFLRAPATAQSDIYSLGVVLFHAATGRYPIEGRSLGEIRDAHAARRPVSVRSMRPDLSPAVAALIDRARDPDPAQRFATARDMEAALARTTTRFRTRLVAAALISVAVVGVAYVATIVRRGRTDAAQSAIRPAERGATADQPSASPVAERPEVIRPPTADGARPAAQPPRAAPRAPAGPPQIRIQEVNAGLFDKANLRAPAPNGLQATCTPFGVQAVAICDLQAGTWRVLRTPSSVGQRSEMALLSPDASLIAYLWVDATGRSVRLMGADGSADRALYPAGQNVEVYRWVPDGTALLVRVFEPSGACSFVEVSLAGAAREVARAPAPGDLSPDGRFVIMTRAVGEQDRDLVLFSTASGEESIILPDPGDDDAPRWLPDGSGIVFVSTRRGDKSIFYAAIANGQASAPRMLHAFGRVNLFLQGFSGDGTLFVRVVALGADAFVATLDLDRRELGTRRQVSPSSWDTFSAPDWSPDQRSVVYMQVPGGGQSAKLNRVIIKNVETGQEQSLPLPSGSISAPRWLSDGRRIAVSYVENRTSVIDVITDLESGSARRVAAAPSIRWMAPHPSADVLYYSQLDEKPSRLLRIHRVDLQSGETTVAYDGVKHGRLVEFANFDVSPAGDLLVVAGRPGGNVVRVLRADGSVTDLAGFRFDCAAVAWAPDAVRALAHCSAGGVEYVPWVIDSSGQATRLAGDSSLSRLGLTMRRDGGSVGFLGYATQRPTVWTIGGIR